MLKKIRVYSKKNKFWNLYDGFIKNKFAIPIFYLDSPLIIDNWFKRYFVVSKFEKNTKFLDHIEIELCFDLLSKSKQSLKL